MTINSSSIPSLAQTAARSGTLLAGLGADVGAAKRPGQNFAQLLGSVTQLPAAPTKPPLPERPPMPRVEVEPPPREPDVPRSTEPVPVAPDRAPAQAERSANAAAAKSDSPSATGAKPAVKTVNAPANAAAKAKAPTAAAKTPGQTDAAATDKASAAADDAVAGELSRRTTKTGATDDAGLAAVMLTAATPEPTTASLSARDAGLPGATGAEPDAAAAVSVSPDAAADPGSLASLMPSVAQAVFGQAAVGAASANGSVKADASASPVTTGDATSPLPGAELAAASTPAGAAARTKAEPVAADPAQQASIASTQRTESTALASAAQESAKSLAIDAKPQVGAASFGQMLQAATAAAPTGPNGAQASAPSTPVTVSSPLHEPGFAPEMATRLTLLASEGVQKAQLHLNPAEMGPVSVQIQLDGQQAQVEFHAQHAATREVLERSLPELAAALRDAGMTLSGGGVFQQQRDAQQDDQAKNQGARQGTTGIGDDSGALDNPGLAMGQQAGRRTQIGVLDMYA
ncbi:flagellar hook-length control protein FliK [Roseateles toxinivorans]|uniref:Flagellar hook-length control protein FliK n=1 Tax=Roseateles toxinivorans TaxID=270368 RepID=A0A4R6QNV8_9BURK|nr:flagellar hook-length control protein FliK [Roseateles toxinivorans]TDP71612.1 flagellar hook-length control protein FliK [Roseateles toxinivorans]